MYIFHAIDKICRGIEVDVKLETGNPSRDQYVI